jgi:hypothetical protein
MPKGGSPLSAGSSGSQRGGGSGGDGPSSLSDDDGGALHVLVLGGTQFMGRLLVEKLLQLGHKVCCAGPHLDSLHIQRCHPRQSHDFTAVVTCSTWWCCGSVGYVQVTMSNRGKSPNPFTHVQVLRCDRMAGKWDCCGAS